ncbi:uncharacterized protein MONBRDRAFT_33116 [Monosiga brevicollis MX1]|uniref:Protein kinase domain-containing protein n=1 Tax=Monosiga brevicollis TaxID=81824 RepID=A9V3T0_MONBE|nr:uncharacterized protein MONBRDRAFT_33116 [Monosiga brevicollis MX1]EDQ87760.1 predicted protein [Monosiga brevicollis MX1]|eukprot:XP_001747293.1 hypothetical protein [Monosiga brevicollis MX1]
MASKAFRQKMAQSVVDCSTIFANAGCVGQGTYGIVHKVYRLEGTRQLNRGCALRQEGDDLDDTTKPYALKGMVTSVSRTEGFSTANLRELALLRELHHDNVISLREAFIHSMTKEVWLLFDYAEYDLWWLCNDHRSANLRLQEPMLKSIMFQLLQGVHYLHEQWVLHRDLKPANVFLTRGGSIKIGDLGMARVFVAPPKAFSDVDPVVVTYWYRAPEIMLGAKHYTKAIDIWSIGCIFAELINLVPIFHVKNDQNSRDPYYAAQLEAIFKVLGMPDEQKWSLLKHMPRYPDLKRDFKTKASKFDDVLSKRMNEPESSTRLSLMRRMFHYDPEKRISADEALTAPWFKSVDRFDPKNCFAKATRAYPARELDKPSEVAAEAPSHGETFKHLHIALSRMPACLPSQQATGQNNIFVFTQMSMIKRLTFPTTTSTAVPSAPTRLRVQRLVPGDGWRVVHRSEPSQKDPVTRRTVIISASQSNPRPMLEALGFRHSASYLHRGAENIFASQVSVRLARVSNPSTKVELTPGHDLLECICIGTNAQEATRVLEMLASTLFPQVRLQKVDVHRSAALMTRAAR